MRTPGTNAALERTISRDRLEKYLQAANGDLDHALTLYERNTRLSEAFYSSLQGLEVCLRNSLHLQLIARYGEDWFRDGNAPLENDARGDIEKALSEFRPGEATPGKLIAELRFGFWVSLIGPRYDATLWRQALYKAFTAKGGHPRNRVHGRFNAIRRFRNRIAHHEPIFHRPIETFHNEVLEAIGWMCRDTAAWVEHHSRLPAVYNGEQI